MLVWMLFGLDLGAGVSASEADVSASEAESAFQEAASVFHYLLQETVGHRPRYVDEDEEVVVGLTIDHFF